MKEKVLILPTYFPTKASPIIGSQVKEQAKLLTEYFDIKVVQCLPGMGWKRFIVSTITGLIFRNKKYASLQNVLKQDSIQAYGVYFFYNKHFPESLNSKLKNKAYNHVFKKLLKSGWKPDLLNSRGFEYGGESALYLSKKYNIPFIHTENTALLFDYTFSENRLKLYKKVLTGANSLFFVSNFLLRITLMHGFIKKKNYHVTGNSVDEDLFFPNNELKKTEKFRILITGYNSYIKDYDTFFKAVQLLVKNNHTKITAVIALTYGDERSKEELIQKAKSLNIERNCEFHIQVARNKMPQLINSCNVFVSTSIVETFGIGMLEAMFCGTPVVATRNGGIEDFITEKNGILCDIGDYIGLSNSIKHIIEGKRTFNPEEIRNSVINKYGKDAFKKRLRKLYIDTINEFQNLK